MSAGSDKSDSGFTDLVFHKHISKNSDEVEAIGDLDELTCYLGLVKCKMRLRRDKAILERIQHAVLEIATEIAIGEDKKRKMGLLLKKQDVDWIKSVIGQLERTVKQKSCFYMPGKKELSAYLDIARTVARRAERSAVGVFMKHKIKNHNILSYLDCVSDILFIMARKSEQMRASKTKSKTVSKLKRQY
ncbi:MAG: cob(I)yrinic acid a,c-diamide adenosyltransferase [Candidatus Omnitrophota bacterium]